MARITSAAYIATTLLPLPMSCRLSCQIDALAHWVTSVWEDYAAGWGKLGIAPRALPPTLLLC